MSIKKIVVDVIGLKGFPAEFVGSSGIEFYVQHIILNSASNLQFNCYGRTWAKTNFKTPSNTKVILLPTVKTKILDALIYSFFASLATCFSDSKTVWTHSTGTSVFSFLPKLFGKKIIYTVHRAEWQSDKWNRIEKRLLLYTHLLIIKWANVVTTVSSKLKETIKNQIQNDKDIKLILPGLNSPKKISSEQSYRVMKYYSIKKNKYILYLGRITPEKRIEWLIKAFSTIKSSSLQLVIAGDESNTTEYFNKICKLAQINKNIKMIGSVFGNEKEAILQNCLLYVLPSSIEGNSISLLEAISYSKNCVVASENIDIEIASQKNVFVFKGCSFSNFKNIFTFALKRSLLSQNQKIGVNKNYNWSKSANLFAKFVTE